MKGGSLDEGDAVTSAPIGGQQRTKAGIVAACKIDMSALIGIRKKSEHFWSLTEQLVLGVHGG